MTIAAGFCVHDSILLCADTMYSGSMKVYEQKIFPATITGEHYAFALAGHEGFGKLAIQECQDAIAEVDPVKRTLKRVRQILQTVIKQIHEDYIDKRPFEEREASRFFLLIAAWLPRGGGAKLFSTHGLAVVREDGFQCIGSGEYLGRYIVGNVYRRDMRLDEVSILAAQMLLAAKSYDIGCGGSSQFALVTHDGILMPDIHRWWMNAEPLLSMYEIQARELLMKIGQPDCPDVIFDDCLEGFVANAKSLRKAWQSYADLIRARTNAKSDGDAGRP